MNGYVPLPPLPARIGRLNELAYDLWWSWHPKAREVFRDLDYPLWRFTDHNPVLLLHLVEPERLGQAASDPRFLSTYDDAMAELDVVRAGAGTWWSRRSIGTQPIAWITPEFSMHQSLPVNTSGPGVLSGDFCKEASDLGVPLVGVGLMYPRGYAHQRLSAEGWQQEAYEYIDWSDAPIGPALCSNGQRCTVTLPLGGGTVRADVWHVRAGRVTLYLLDTDVPENAPWDRELSSKSFADESDSRMRQAVLLAAGSVRALERLGIEPAMWHVAEGTAALVVLERLQRAIGSGLSYDQALAHVSASTVFSTRDGAPGRSDSFSFASIDRYLATVWSALQPHRTAVFALGGHESDREIAFNVSVLGARSCAVLNVPESAAGTGAVAAWTSVRGVEAAASAVRAIPEGVHLSSWISADLGALFDAHLGHDWRERQDDPGVWAAVETMPDEHLWAVRGQLRRYLVDFVRERARRMWAREQASGNRLVALGTLLDPATLTIGFARRLTDGARPELVFEDAERLARIIAGVRRPVQFVFAGKAEPGDESGKHHLQRVFRHALDPAFGGRVAFVEDYDLHVARLLVQGCDVWLSTPRRGCPTSIGGIKAAVNGVPQLATADAWWAGGCTGDNGWVIDGGQARDAAAQDAADAKALYRILEEEIVPAFYERNRAGVPSGWTAVMKQAIATTLPRFCARQTVKAFADAAYLPGIEART
jgi:starch phosphorylase